jgi:hypothetical protein
MKSLHMPPQIAWPVALVGAAAVLVVGNWVLGLGLLFSGLAAVLVFVALYLILDPRTEKEVQTDDYGMQARASMRKTLDDLRSIDQMMRNIPPGPVQQQVASITALGRTLMAQVEQKRPNELLSAAAALDYRTQKLQEALGVYSDIVRDPRKQAQAKYADVTQRIATKTLPAVEQWLSNNVDRLNAGDILQLEVNLDQLEASQYESLK